MATLGRVLNERNWIHEPRWDLIKSRAGELADLGLAVLCFLGSLRGPVRTRLTLRMLQEGMRNRVGRRK